MRKAKIERETKETVIEVSLNLDGSGKADIKTGIKFFDHLLQSFARHGRLDLSVDSRGDFEHHIAEDTMICLGKGVGKALGDKTGIRRMGDAIVPMDDSLSLVAIDLGGRVYSDIRVKFTKEKLVDMTSDLFVHLLETFANNAECNLHVEILRGSNDHHMAEATFKALGVSLTEAVRQVGQELPTTKGVI